MNLESLARRVPDFDKWGYADRIRFFLWYLHAEGKKDQVSLKDIGKCFDQLHVDKPANLAAFPSSPY